MPRATLTALGAGLAVCFLIGLFVWATSMHDKSVADGDPLLKRLLGESKLSIEVPYEILNCVERRSPPFRGGRPVFRYFQLKLNKGDGQRILHDQAFRARVPFNERQQLLATRPAITWWKAENEAPCYFGALSAKETRDAVYFQIVLGLTNDWMFIDSKTAE